MVPLSPNKRDARIFQCGWGGDGERRECSRVLRPRGEVVVEGKERRFAGVGRLSFVFAAFLGCAGHRLVRSCDDTVVIGGFISVGEIIFIAWEY